MFFRAKKQEGEECETCAVGLGWAGRFEGRSIELRPVSVFQQYPRIFVKVRLRCSYTCTNILTRNIPKLNTHRIHVTWQLHITFKILISKWKVAPVDTFFSKCIFYLLILCLIWLPEQLSRECYIFMSSPFSPMHRSPFSPVHRSLCTVHRSPCTINPAPFTLQKTFFIIFSPLSHSMSVLCNSISRHLVLQHKHRKMPS